MSFWKESKKNVPGRPSPHKESSWSKPKVSGGTSSFQDFDASVRDAWDINDDEFSVISSDLKISEAAAQIAALNVINNHRTTNTKGGEEGDGNSEDGDEDDTSNGGGGSPNTTTSQSQSSPTKKQLNNSNHDSSSNQSTPRRQSSTVPKQFIHSSHPSFGNTKSKVICRIESEREKQKADKIRTLLKSSSVELKELQSLSYSGLPYSIRGTAWKLLAGYLPTYGERRNEVLARKREEYWNCVKQYYDSRLDEGHQDTFRQIHIDIPRMCPLIALFQQPVVQEMFERILFIWAIRHPASGYVQGMNDLVTPFFVVFLEETLPPHIEVETFDVTCLPEDLRNSIEADSYWCMSKFLDSIQVNYIFAQTGIQEKVRKLKELIERIDAPLNQHLKTHEIDYLQFSFRWMNNLLMRELPLRCTIRLWDTYLAEPDGCGSVLLYVCAAFLSHWRKELIEQKDFQGLMLLLQNLPTQGWESEDISLIVAEAYRLKYTFDSAPKHLGGGSTK